MSQTKCRRNDCDWSHTFLSLANKLYARCPPCQYDVMHNDIEMYDGERFGNISAEKSRSLCVNA